MKPPLSYQAEKSSLFNSKFSAACSWESLLSPAAPQNWTMVHYRQLLNNKMKRLFSYWFKTVENVLSAAFKCPSGGQTHPFLESSIHSWTSQRGAPLQGARKGRET